VPKSRQSEAIRFHDCLRKPGKMIDPWRAASKHVVPNSCRESRIPKDLALSTPEKRGSCPPAHTPGKFCLGGCLGLRQESSPDS
jgi:hypothetical protein